MFGINYFNLELDTTPPSLFVVYPPSNYINEPVDIHITTSDILDAYQNIHYFDKNNNKVNLVFQRISDYELYGIVSFNTIGDTILYVQLRDDVLNTTIINEYTISLVERTRLILNIFRDSRNTNNSIFKMESKISTSELRKIVISTLKYKIESTITNMEVKCMVTYQSGNTIKLDVEFYDYSNVLVDPNTIQLIIYNSSYSVLETITILPEHKKSVGKYSYEYTIPQSYRGTMHYEWKGIINGSASIKRDSVSVSFI